jgi:hypothetical protein
VGGRLWWYYDYIILHQGLSVGSNVIKGHQTDGYDVICEGVSKRFRTGFLEREQQMVQLCDTRCSCIAIL